MTEETETETGAEFERRLPDGSEWQFARKYLTSLGEPSALFTGCSRSLLRNSSAGLGQLPKQASIQLARLLQSPSMLAQIFFAAKTYYPKDISSRGSVEPADFIFFITPAELALIITIGYSTRRIAPMLDKQDWELIWEPYQRYVDLSMPLGFAIPSIGPSRALMAASGKFLGWCYFSFQDKDSFKKYRIANKVQKRSFNLDDELHYFGTTHLHISALILQSFGFGVQTCEDYLAGLSDNSTSSLPPGAVPFRVARIWLESLMEQGNPPANSLGDDYELESSRSEQFIETFQSIKNFGSEFKWLLKNKDDISSELTPDLQVDFAAMKKVLKKRGRNVSKSSKEDSENDE